MAFAVHICCHCLVGESGIVQNFAFTKVKCNPKDRESSSSGYHYALQHSIVVFILQGRKHFSLEI